MRKEFAEALEDLIDAYVEGLNKQETLDMNAEIILALEVKHQNLVQDQPKKGE